MQHLRLVAILGITSLSLLGLTPKPANACPYCGGLGIYGTGYYGGPGYYGAGSYAPPWVYSSPGYFPTATVWNTPWAAPSPWAAYYGYSPRAYYPYSPWAFYPYYPAAYSWPWYSTMYPRVWTPPEISIGVSDGSYQPATLTVRQGAVVRWLNNGNHAHTVTSKDGKWDSGDIPPGGSFAAKFEYAGTYQVYCRYHKGMVGTIVVEPTGP